MSVLKDFRDFAIKGSVIDLAIGVIIGAAFGKIVTSLVEDILMPPLGLLTGKIDFAKLAFKVAEGPLKPDGTLGEPVMIRYGNFLQISIQFIIVAFVIFMITQAIVKVQKAQAASLEVAPAAPSEPEVSSEEKLLAEIRDLLKSRPL